MLDSFKSGLSKLSLIGKALMLPISILPAAGLLLAFGAKLDIPSNCGRALITHSIFDGGGHRKVTFG